MNRGLWSLIPDSGFLRTFHAPLERLLEAIAESGVQVEIVEIREPHLGRFTNQTIEPLKLRRRDGLVAKRSKQFGNGSVVGHGRYFARSSEA